MVSVTVIGGGIIGCAILRELALNGVQCTLLERTPNLVMGASGGNSGLLHTGFDATPGTLEANLVRKGYKMLVDLHEVTGLPTYKCGALLVAWNEEEVKYEEKRWSFLTSTESLMGLSKGPKRMELKLPFCLKSNWKKRNQTSHQPLEVNQISVPSNWIYSCLDWRRMGSWSFCIASLLCTPSQSPRSPGRVFFTCY